MITLLKIELNVAVKFYLPFDLVSHCFFHC